MTEATVESPCVKVCTLDESGRLCLGCFRTIDEIGLWTQLSHPERAQVVKSLPEREMRYHKSFAAMALADDWKSASCERCGAQFTCGAQDRSRPCWCMSYPPVPPAREEASCLCPACLAMGAK